MGVSKQVITEDLKLKLHFQRISKMQSEEPLRFKTQNARIDFIRYCLIRGEKLSENTTGELNQFIFYQQPKNKAQVPSNQTTQLEDMNKKKLSLLFAHLTAFNYELGDLTIEPVTPAVLIKKMNEINEMSSDKATHYLNRLIGEKIPGYEQMSPEEFLNQIAEQYKNNGLNFHCYLRENFFQPLNIESIKQAEPLLNYFMPKVFSQQHINTCVLVTQMSLSKKMTANFNQLKNTFLSKEKELPEKVKEAESKLISLQNDFSDYLSTALDKNPEEIKKILHNYKKQLKIIQTELEKQILSRIAPEIQPCAKKYDNFILSVLHHLISKVTIPYGVDSWFFAIDGTVSRQLNRFQNSLLGVIFNRFISVSEFSAKIDDKKKDPVAQLAYQDQIKSIFLNGTAVCSTSFVIIWHALIMDIDEEGRLKLIEHKNSSAETTTLSTNILSEIGIKNHHQEPAQEAINSIDKTLERLYMERDNILKVKAGTIEDNTVQKELSDLLLEKDDEIKNLTDIKLNIQQKHGITPPQEQFKKAKESLQAIKENIEPKPPSLSLK